MMIKAYGIVPYDTGEGALLVFAPNRNRARYIALTHGTWEYAGYASINARRRPVYDGAYDTETVIDTNEDLPPGFPPFYWDDDEDEEWA